MKKDKHLYLRKRRGRKPGKAGSSLALVMMIGAALVIWVMCIMPLMTTTGTTAIQTEEKYDDYLESRSSIEYCKSELERMVNEGNIPSTFAVVKSVASGDVTYTAYPKTAGGIGDYYSYVKTDATDDRKDEPLSDVNGDLVTAICAVVPDEDDPSVYNITIQTYHNGEKGQVYKLKYTLAGSLLIYPESYNQNQALPLSDFVLVDGKLGDNEVWKSTITMDNAVVTISENKTGTGNFTEELLSYDLDKMKDIEYASSQEYPAVFKKTVDAASTGEGGEGDIAHGNVFTDGDFTDEVWIEPTANGNQGRISIDTTNGTISVKLDGGDITDQCTVYLNGEECKDKKVPNKEGYYSVTIDYEGTGEYNSNAVNVLPVSGLSVGTIGDGVGSGTVQPLGAKSSIENVVKVEGENGTTYTVTLESANDSDILYGYSSSDNKTSVTWGKSNVFAGLSGNKDYFFFICRPAKMDNGVYYRDSEVGYVGMIYPMTLARELKDGDKYLVLGGSDYAMTSTLGAKKITSYVQSDFIIDNSDSGIGVLSWTASQSDNEWRFKNNGNNQSITMTGSYDLNNKWQRQWNLSLGTAGQNDDTGLFTVKFGDNETDATVTRQIYYTYFDLTKWKDVEVTTPGYLTYSSKDNRFAATTTSSTVSFLKIPTAPNVRDIAGPTESYSPTEWTATFDEDIMTLVKTDIQPKVDIVTLYANGSPVSAQTDGKYILAAGKYSLAADIEVDGIQYCVSLGHLTVNKYTFNSGYPMAVCTTDRGDEMTVHVSRTGGHDIGSKYWFGYRVSGSEDAFTWFPATSEDGLSRSFRLKPGSTYEFAVKECGTMNYNSCVSDDCVKWQVTPIPVTLEPTLEQLASFRYELSNEGEPIWYELPKANGDSVQIYPYRVHLVYGVPVGDSGFTWQANYDSEKVRYFGVVIDGSNFTGNPDLNAEGAVLQISPPSNFSNVGGHTSSVMRGESLYFMGQSYTLDGESYSIRTYGNKIYLYTDLLVLKSGITGGTDETTGKDYPIGEVWVKPYSDGDDKDTLFFNPNEDSIFIGSTEFEGRTFYKIAPNTNLCGPTTSSQIKRFGKLSSEDAYKAEKKEIQKSFREKKYPEINLDIAYADDAQLAHIVSGETIGWTNDGVLSGSSTSYNESYAVCAYVSKISSDVSYMANRVLIAAAKVTTPTGDFVCELNVPKNVTFGTRYLSIDADAVNKVGSGTFKINNLAQDQNFIDIILDKTKFNTYISKTLQIDFERSTSINGDKPIGPTICRYKAGDDLFGAGSHTLPLMADYTASEINSYFKNKASSIIHSVDRYVTLKGDATVGTSISAWSTFTCKHDIYANYVYVDGITNITLYSIFDSDIRFHSQESGYTEKEYLGLFTSHSADSYNGTLVYLKNDVQLKIISLKGWDSATIKAGFYYVPATKDGTSISDLSLDTYSITKEELAKIAVYVDPLTGEVKNAYVDTGIFDNTSSGLGGFSGGNVG